LNNHIAEQFGFQAAQAGNFSSTKIIMAEMFLFVIIF